MTTETKTYNGWTNYETWAVKLWMDNDRNSCEHMREMASDATTEAPDHHNVPTIWTVEEATKFLLSDALKDWHEEAMPEIDGVWSDLLNAAMSEVNWDEIAENILSED